MQCIDTLLRKWITSGGFETAGLFGRSVSPHVDVGAVIGTLKNSVVEYLLRYGFVFKDGLGLVPLHEELELLRHATVGAKTVVLKQLYCDGEVSPLWTPRLFDCDRGILLTFSNVVLDDDVLVLNVAESSYVHRAGNDFDLRINTLLIVHEMREADSAVVVCTKNIKFCSQLNNCIGAYALLPGTPEVTHHGLS